MLVLRLCLTFAVAGVWRWMLPGFGRGSWLASLDATGLPCLRLHGLELLWLGFAGAALWTWVRQQSSEQVPKRALALCLLLPLLASVSSPPAATSTWSFAQHYAGLLAWMALLWGGAVVVDRWGVGRGFSILALVILCDALARPLGAFALGLRVGLYSSYWLFWSAFFWGGMVYLLWKWLLEAQQRFPHGCIRPPNTGILPLCAAYVLAFLPAQSALPWLRPWADSMALHKPLYFIAIPLMILLLAAGFAGLLLRLFWAAQGKAFRHSWRRATLRSVALLQMLFLFCVLEERFGVLSQVLVVATPTLMVQVALAAALSLDLAQECLWRWQHPRAVLLHQGPALWEGDELLLALREQQIHAHLSGALHKSLLSLAGPHLSTGLWVPRGQKEAAQALLREHLSKNP